MKSTYFFLVLSAVLYALPFLLSDYFWWLIFIFPVPLLYLTRSINLSFIHGYVWGCIVFMLQLSGGIYLIADMAGKFWPVGVALGMAMIFYQALVLAFLFWGVTKVVTIFSIQHPLMRLSIWAIALCLFIMWVDWYCLWIFGVQEGYPLMHPLLLLAQKPTLLCLLPIIGKPLLTGLFLLVPAGIVLVLWYQNSRALLFLSATVIFWLFCLLSHDPKKSEPALWRAHIKSLPHMFCCTSDDPTVIIKIVSNQIKKLIAAYPETNIIIMPESAFNTNNFAELPELLQLWSEDCLGKAVHLIFGASRWDNGNYYNSLHWVYNGKLQQYYDKKHAMLMSEKLAVWMNYDCLKDIYFNARQPIAVSCDERQQLFLQNMSFVPYICSELFFNEWPDDIYDNPVIAIVNDLLFVTYMQKLLVLLAQFKAVQWQRDIIYVSYAQSLFIDREGEIVRI